MGRPSCCNWRNIVLHRRSRRYKHPGQTNWDTGTRPRQNGFANEDGTPNTELPVTTMRVTIEEIGGGKTRMWIESKFPTSRPWSSSPLWAGRRAGRKPVGQIDAILAEGRDQAR
jgi:hypothetical protein